MSDLEFIKHINFMHRLNQELEIQSALRRIEFMDKILKTKDNG